MVILLGDAANVLKDFKDESIDCVVTSPPYWALRDYKVEGSVWDADPNCEHDFSINHNLKKSNHNRSNHGTHEQWDLQPSRPNNPDFGESQFCSKCNAWKGSFGLEPTFQLYIKHMLDIFDQIKRILKKEGTCWVVLGDTYAGTGNKGEWTDPKYDKGRNGQAVALNNKVEGIKDKSLCQIPQRFAIGMIDRGWILRNDIIWHKPNCMPSSATDRFTVDYEHVFFFVKSQRYYFKTQYEPFTDIQVTETGAHSMYGVVRNRNLEYNTKYEYMEGNQKQLYKGTSKTIAPKNAEGRIKRTVWQITTRPYPDAHFAVFPEELIKTPIVAGCPEGGTVLDPFAGSGTTLLAAHKLLRNWIGIEINKDYVALAKKRLTPYVQQQRLTSFQPPSISTGT